MKTTLTNIRSERFLIRLFSYLALLLSSLNSLLAQEYDMSLGDDYGAVIDDSGNLFIWGALTGGDGSIQQVLPAGAWADVSASRTSGADAHVLAIRTDGSLWAFGSNTRGQLGDGTTTDRTWNVIDDVSSSGPVQIGSSTDWVEVAAGEFHSIARDSFGFIFLWGDNTYGQLGISPIFNDPNIDIRTEPTALLNGLYDSIAAGSSHSHGIRTDGTLWAWGSGGASSNGGPELGLLVNGTFPIGPVQPTQVGTSTGWRKLFGGYYGYLCAIRFSL